MDMTMPRGRPPVIGEPELALIDKLYMKERMSVRDIADVMGVSHMTIWRALREFEEAGAWS